MNHYFYSLAHRAAQAAADEEITKIDPRWIYAQWVHESNNFTSQLAAENHNLGGLTQEEANDSPQPDGSCYYINFVSYEDYADYFGHYLRYFVDGGIDQATNLTEYITALKNSPSGAYFGDSLENYLSDCQEIYAENFPEQNASEEVEAAEKIVLSRVDNSGVFALPDGVAADRIVQVLLNGQPAEYVPVKDNTEIDVPGARPDLVVEVVLR